jgi:large subunit ribosomal protein L9
LSLEKENNLNGQKFRIECSNSASDLDSLGENMKVILQKDVRNLGKVGDLVNVKSGYARNFLFPNRLAQEATGERVRQVEHITKMAQSLKKKAKAEKLAVAEKVKGITLTFKRQAGEGDRLFGSVTATDIAKELDTKGFAIERRDIQLKDPIKTLGQYKVILKLEADVEAELVLTVDKAE